MNIVQKHVLENQRIFNFFYSFRRFFYSSWKKPIIIYIFIKRRCKIIFKCFSTKKLSFKIQILFFNHQIKQDIVNKKRIYFHPVGGGPGGWPSEPPNYIAFRYGGKLQTIHHIDQNDFTEAMGIYSRIKKMDDKTIFELQLNRHGYDAMVGHDPMNSSVLDVVVHPKHLPRFKCIES